MVIETPSYMDAIRLALKDPDCNVRYAAVKSLGSVGASSSVKELAEKLEDMDVSVRRKAAQVLARVTGAACV